jgi:tRNA1Val (adenine37-N6)-methyltransferase
MPNNYFQFKQFTIHQHKSAMKVCTDACLFGAFVADVIQKAKGKIQKEETEVKPQTSNLKQVLDIGTGTGLLSLILAQKTNAYIDAVEIDEDTAEQAAENIAASPWKDRVTVHQSTIQQYNTPTKYDFIITNPPFFENDLKSDNSKRNLALHSEALSLEELLISVKRLLAADGSFAVLLPYHRTTFFEQLASEHHLFLQQKVLIKQTEKHQPFRSILLYNSSMSETIEKEIIIKQQGEYSQEFTRLLSDYYLYL